MQGLKRKSMTALLAGATLLAGTAPAFAQRHDNFYNGARQGGHGSYQYDNRHDRGYYDRRDDRRDHGIGPGKGALIGGAGGAVLGAAFGGGLGGAVIGGAAGAGIGALIGKGAQDRRRGHR